MKELRGNLFDPSSYLIQNPPTRGFIPLNKKPDAICITTNGFVKTNGECVMGRGCAKQAANKWPGLATDLGSLIRKNGNIVQEIATIGTASDMIMLLSFPVKPVSEICNRDKSNVVKHMQKQFKPGQRVPGWACVADPGIIVRSAEQLKERCKSSTVILPRPGCGAGSLSWNIVRPILEDILDNRFYCITFR